MVWNICDDFLVIFWQQTSVSSNMSLQIERIIESFIAICTLVFFVWRVISSMAIEHADMFEALATDFTFKFGTMAVTSLDTTWHWLLMLMAQSCRWLKFSVKYGYLKDPKNRSRAAGAHRSRSFKIFQDHFKGLHLVSLCKINFRKSLWFLIYSSGDLISLFIARLTSCRHRTAVRYRASPTRYCPNVVS